MDANLRVHIGFEDHILFQTSQSTARLYAVRDGLFVGKIARSLGDTFQVRIFNPMTSEFLKQFSLPPISTAASPMAAQAHMIELIGQDSFVEIQRCEVYDIAFVVPLSEVESGLFHMSGSCNSFYTRYSITNGTVEQCVPDYYFVSRPVEPVSIRLFHSLNTLAGLLKKSFYHIGEAESCIRNFRLFFNTEAFCYIYYKLCTVTIVSSKPRKQTCIMYYDSLKLESRTSFITKTCLQVVTKLGLSKLREMLGVGVGLGLTKRKPTKKNPIVVCTQGSFLTSVELQDNIPFELTTNPPLRYSGNSIEFLFTEETRQLACTVRYSKIIIHSSDVATSRIPTADVHENPVGGAYVMANFHYNGELMTIISIQNNYATCQYLNDDFDSDDNDFIDNRQTIDLPLEEVNALVASFGK